ncbi:MAG: type I-C CRISPR-associated endonuclease Cas1 [Phycisphaerae bacterium]|nr:type I-C CRISPR-associated endonuclease Cas1 [Phycisphaerae bacterium]
MKHLLNTLFVTTDGAYLGHEGQAVIVRVAKETRLRVPLHTLGGIACFGRVGMSPPLMRLCGRHKVAVSFFSPYGRFLARVCGPVSGNVLLRREQYRCADKETSASAMARAVVSAKIANARNVLLRAIRDRPDDPNNGAIGHAARRLAGLLEELRNSLPPDIVRGIEGEAAKGYFGVFDHLVTAQKGAFFFRQRTRRPPTDNVNALLSFLYTLLTNDVASALEGVGLDPAVGFFHRDRPGRMGLALDVMEEFRPFLADRLALALINRQQIRDSGFRKTESGAVVMDDETRKQLLISYQKRKQEEILHPFIGEKVAVGLLPHVQAMLLARHLRGDLDGYPPFFWK